jgi:hypothetical protein
VHLVPATQTVAPVHPCPPHCAYLAATAPVAAGADVDGFETEPAVVVVVTKPDEVVVGAFVETGTAAPVDEPSSAPLHGAPALFVLPPE